MRKLTDKLKQNIQELKNFTYLFEIELKNGNFLFLNSSSNEILSQYTTYYPYSGLSIINAHFNENAHDYINITGIFEEKGINKDTFLIGAKVKILFYSDTLIQELVTYHCSKYEINSLTFKFTLSSESQKYSQLLINNFSKKCRTNFGDSKCKFDKNLVSTLHKIIKINGKFIIFENLNKEDDYYTHGDFIINEKISIKILKHYQNTIELESLFPNFLENDNIILIAGCNKNFITCCNKFNNAVNFRGEPLIPNEISLKI